MRFLKEPHLDRGGKLVLTALIVDRVFGERPYLGSPQLVIEAGVVSVKTRGTGMTRWIHHRLEESLPFYDVILLEEGNEHERIEVQVDPVRFKGIRLQGSKSKGSTDGRGEGSEAGSVRPDPVAPDEGDS